MSTAATTAFFSPAQARAHIPSAQTAAAVVMVRPGHFRANPETAADNAFQAKTSALSAGQMAHRAFAEVTEALDRLRGAGVVVHLFEDQEAGHPPDSVFPNNWFSTHASGQIVLYPMYSPQRRTERRMDIVHALRARYQVHGLSDYAPRERSGQYLEGTGAMVLDHVDRVAYVALSKRADPVLVQRFCGEHGYTPMLFDTADANGLPVYHTNVMMCIATGFVLVCLELLPDPQQRQALLRRLRDSQRTVLPLTQAQVAAFAGNALELAGTDGPILAMSRRGVDSLAAQQRQTIEQFCRILPLDVPTIELSGGSVRCMLADIHLPRQPSL